MKSFLERTFHVNGGFDNTEGMPKLHARMEQVEVKWYLNQNVHNLHLNFVKCTT